MKIEQVGVLGASGLVGREMLQQLHEAGYPVSSIRAAASERSVGKHVPYAEGEVVLESVQSLLDNPPVALLMAVGADISRELAPQFAQKGCLVIDNSSAWRMDPKVPLVVPEVNADALSGHSNLIANPNCSTIQLMVAIAPIHRHNPIVRLRVSTYQAVSGSGVKGLTQLENELAGNPVETPAYPQPIAGNCIPHCDRFGADDYTEEELKVTRESRRILSAPELLVSCTAVRVPVRRGHSESVSLECLRPITPTEVRQLLADAPGVILMDNPAEGLYPTPLKAEGTNPVYVGRIRQDLAMPTHGINLWVVADNVRKGAAANAVQILERIRE